MEFLDYAANDKTDEKEIEESIEIDKSYYRAWEPVTRLGETREMHATPKPSVT